jgi:hypothetical protein
VRHQFLRSEDLSQLRLVKQLAVAVSAVMFLAGCAQRQPRTAEESPTPGATETSSEGSDLTLTLDIEPAQAVAAGSEVTFELTLRANQAITLQFGTSQRYEFVVERSGTRVWGASDGKAYLQVLGSESLEPGEERKYSDRWTAERAGNYVVVASIPASDRSDLSVKREFSVE